jgi:signal transduction histidine kinase
LRDITREKLIEKAKSEFIRLSTHQLWTPASAVKWSLQILLEGDIGDLSKKQRELIEKIYKANNREIKLIGDLLIVAQIEMGRCLSGMVLSDIGELIQFLIDNYKREAEKKEIKIEFRKPEEQLPKVMIDVEKMKLAIKNIINNAVKYTSSRGTIVISLKKNKKEIEVQISDTGMGIPKNQQERVFTKFFRGSNITQIDTEGTGLGLYIAKNIIESHGGRIWFESEKGKGTTFYFTVPVKKEFGEFITGEFY